MRFVAYGRVAPETSEIPLSTQKSACHRFCEREDHGFEGWYTDECLGDLPFFERDGFSLVLEKLTSGDVDGILTYERNRVSSDPGRVSSLRPLTQMFLGREIPVWTPEGEVDLSESPDPETYVVADAMVSLTTAVEGWSNKMSDLKRRASMLEKIEEGHALGRLTFGLESDRQRFENRSTVNEILPDDRKEDNFKEAISILNEFGHRGTTPMEPSEPTADSVSKKYGHTVSTIKNIWKNAETYREVAEEHRPELTLLF